MTGPSSEPGALRVASLLPSATEIVCALGLRESLVGVTHECDHPLGISRLPHLTASLLPTDLSSQEIDSAVRASLRADAHTIYSLGAERLRQLQPDVVLTQSLCEVCAVPTAAVEDAVCTMPARAAVVSVDPLRLDEAVDSVRKVGEALGIADRGRAVAAQLRAQLENTGGIVAGAETPTVLAAEWLDPLYCGGHWVPDMIAMAGGRDLFGEPGEPSRALPWSVVRTADPDFIVLMPCGFDARETIRRFGELRPGPDWDELRAVRASNVYAVDATSYFSRPGPRLVDGVRILASILHPDLALDPVPPGSVFQLGPAGDFLPYA